MVFFIICYDASWKNRYRHPLFGKRRMPKIRTLTTQYHHLNLVDDFNMHMNDIDISDHLRCVYRWDTFTRKSKSWCSGACRWYKTIHTHRIVCFQRCMIKHQYFTMLFVKKLKFHGRTITVIDRG